MHKRLSVFLGMLIFVLVAGMLFSACGDKPEAVPAETEAAVTTEPTEDTAPVVPTKPAPSEPAATTDPSEGTEATEPSTGMGVGERGDYSDDTTTAESKPAVTTPAETKPADGGTVESAPTEPQPGTVVTPDTLDLESVTMEMWKQMSTEQRVAIYDSFPTPDDFILWYNGLKTEESTKETVSSDDNTVDLGQLIKP